MHRDPKWLWGAPRPVTPPELRRARRPGKAAAQEASAPGAGAVRSGSRDLAPGAGRGEPRGAAQRGARGGPAPPRRPGPPGPGPAPGRAVSSPHCSAPPAASAQTARLRKSCGRGTSGRSWGRASAGTRAPGDGRPAKPSPASRPCACRPASGTRDLPPGRSRVSPYPARGEHRRPLQSFYARGGPSAAEPRGRVGEVTGRRRRAPAPSFGGVWTRRGAGLVVRNWMDRGPSSRLLCGLGARGGGGFSAQGRAAERSAADAPQSCGLRRSQGRVSPPRCPP